ncbi:MAG: 50S ribosomal protein L11 methyltransferase [Acidobacteria bacterium]|nr:50S ribosomal protein L11 methyltransferase [Acidobacteriota bacterium]
MTTKIWHAIDVEIARVAESVATAQLWAFNTTGLEVSEDSPEFITLRAYFDAAPDFERIKEKIVQGLSLIDLPEAALRDIRPLTIADQDWLAEWKKGYEPVEIGSKLMIAPSWKRPQVGETDRIVVEIDPGMAFGTGTHETTRGCLELLEKYWQGGSFSMSEPARASLPSRQSNCIPDRSSPVSTSIRRRSKWLKKMRQSMMCRINSNLR